jgi:hypothetical protein
MTRAPTSGIRCSGTTNVSPYRALKRWALVGPHGDLVGPVGQDVRGLEHRVEEQARGDEGPLLLGLLLELGHPAQLPECRDAGQHPTQLGVLPDVRLPEEDAPAGVEAGGQEEGRGVVEAFPEVAGVVRHRDGVKVDDAVDGLGAVLALHVLPDGPDVVAEVLPAGRLDAREDAHGSVRVPRTRGGRGGLGIMRAP